MWTVFLLFLLGILVGGVVNRLGSDLPRRTAPTRPRCPYCGCERPWWQWLSVPGYLMGRAQCPSCGAPTGLRPPLVEIGLGLIYGYLWIVWGWSFECLFYGLYSAILALVIVTDSEHQVILDVVTYPACALGIIGSFFLPDATWSSALLGGGVGLTFFFFAALIGQAFFGSGALGGGDVKLAAFVGVITGFPLVIAAILSTLIIGAVISSILLITGIRGLRDHVPYGPFLAMGAVVAYLWGYSIAEWLLL